MILRIKWRGVNIFFYRKKMVKIWCDVKGKLKDIKVRLWLKYWWREGYNRKKGRWKNEWRWRNDEDKKRKWKRGISIKWGEVKKSKKGKDRKYSGNEKIN